MLYLLLIIASLLALKGWAKASVLEDELSLREAEDALYHPRPKGTEQDTRQCRHDVWASDHCYQCENEEVNPHE